MSMQPVTGCGVFLTSSDSVHIARASSAAVGAELGQMRASGVRWAAIWLRSYDGRRLPDDDAERAAGRLRAHDIDVAVWTFPHPDDAQKAGAQIGRISTAVTARLAILDVEDPDGKGPIRWEPSEMDTLHASAADANSSVIAVTSYPGRVGHSMPWAHMAFGVGMPQCYGTADDEAATMDALAKWQKAHGTVIPITSVRTPGREEPTTPAQFRARLDRIAPPGTRAWAAWSWALLRDRTEHLEALRAHAASLGLP